MDNAPRKTRQQLNSEMSALLRRMDREIERRTGKTKAQRKAERDEARLALWNQITR